MGIMEESCPRCGKSDKWRYNFQTCSRCEKLTRLQRVIQWREPNGEDMPDGTLLVEVDTNKGSDCALVFIDDDGETLLCADDFEDVWTAWGWSNVSRYVVLADVLVVR